MPYGTYLVLPEALSLVYQSAHKAVAGLYHMLRLQVKRTHRHHAVDLFACCLPEAGFKFGNAHCRIGPDHCARQPLIYFVSLFLPAYVLRSFLQLPRVSTMASKSQRQKGGDGDRSTLTLDLFIQALSLAKDSCCIPPAQAVFGSVSVLLCTIRVRSLLFCDDEHAHHDDSPGLRGQRTGLCRARADLR